MEHRDCVSLLSIGKLFGFILEQAEGNSSCVLVKYFQNYVYIEKPTPEDIKWEHRYCTEHGTNQFFSHFIPHGLVDIRWYFALTEFKGKTIN